jgi:PAS domain S-box-containing protein
MMRRLARLIPQGSGLTAIAVGVIVLIGWLFNFAVLKSLVGGLNAMKPGTAICLILAGASLFISQRYSESRRADRICWFLSLGICFVALTSLISYIAPPMRMSQSTALSLCLIAAALIASRSKMGLVVTLAAGFFSALALIGYLYGVQALYSVGPYQSMALHTAACLFFLCIGILFSERHHGLGRILFVDSAGAAVARRLLPGSIIVPTGMGVLILLGQSAGWYPQEFGLAIFAVSLILTQIFFVVWSAAYLTQVDRLREAAEADKRERQEQLAQSEERLQSTLSAVSAASFDFDLKKRQLVWSEGFQALFGRDRTPDYEGWLSAIHPDDLANVRAEARAVIRAGEGRAAYRIIREGEIRWIEGRGRRLGKYRFVGLTIDVTERKRAEDELRQYRDIFQFASQAISITVGVEDATFKLINPAYAKMHGFEVEELIGAPVKRVFPPGTHRQLSEAMRASDLAGQYDFESLHVRKDGSEFPVWIELTVVKDEHGLMRYRIVNVTDITERRRIEERLREAAKLESIGVLAGGIAHDFNNILTGILGNASLLLESLPAPSRFRDTARTIMNSSERAADLVRQMLAYSGKGRFVLSLIDLSEKVRETSLLVVPAIPRSTELVHRLTPSLPLIQADAVQIQQVIMNLVINAAEALDGRAGRVVVTTSEKHIDDAFIRELNAPFEITPGRFVLFEVADNGAGMDQPTLAKIFDPFFTTKFTGRGLGLSAVLGIVRGHKGSIKVHSTPGVGTVFQIFFPVAATGEPKHGSRTDQNGNNKIRGRGTVLVVDDEHLIRRTAKSVLENAGFKVVLAEDGYQAIEMFRAKCGEIDLVLLDMSMPRMSGEETLVLLQTIQPDVRVILSSGYNEAEAIGHFEGKGLAGFLQKPYTAAGLAEVMARLS